jgi:hypothetical protein
MELNERTAKEIATVMALDHLALRVPKTKAGAKILINAAFSLAGMSDLESWKNRFLLLREKEQNEYIDHLHMNAHIGVTALTNLFPEDTQFSQLLVQEFEACVSDITGRDFKFTVH